jgi:nicotinamidase-related amidase
VNDLDPTRAALLALDFQNYGVHPQGYWATHGEPDWPAIPNGWCPPTQTSANPARSSLPAKTRSAIAPDTHPAQAL